MTNFRCLFNAALIILLLASCHKDTNNLRPNDIIAGENVTISKIDGYIYADNVNAIIECAGQTTTANSYGYFSFSNITVNNQTAKITVLNPTRYDNQPELVATFIPAANGVHVVAGLGGYLTNFIPFSNQSSGTITSTYYGSANIIEFEANSFVDKTSNTLINGNVIVGGDLSDFIGKFGELSTNTLNTNIPYTGIQGSNYGISSNGEEVGLSIQSVTLKSYFKSVSGNEIGLAPGKKLKIKANGNFPAPTFPAQPIYLWYFDALKNRWIQDAQAVAIINEGCYQAETVNISNDYLFAYSYPVVKVTAKIISNFDNRPVINSLIRFAKQGDKTVLGVVYTNENGELTTLVPKDEPLELSLLSPNGALITNSTNDDAIFKMNIQAISANSDLGTITASSNTTLTNNILFNFKGVALDCNNNPLSNGMITIHDAFNFEHRTKVESDGTFSVNYTRPAGHSSLSWFTTNADRTDCSRKYSTDLYVWRDWLATHTSIKKNYSVDTIILCNQNSNQFIELTIDGVTTTYTAPSSTFQFSEPSQGINYGFPLHQQIEIVGSPSFWLNYEGDRQKGVKSYFVGMNYNNQVSTCLAPFPKVVVTDDEYNGSNYVSGYFNYATVKYIDNSTHIFSCRFRIKRQ